MKILILAAALACGIAGGPAQAQTQTVPSQVAKPKDACAAIQDVKAKVACIKQRNAALRKKHAK